MCVKTYLYQTPYLFCQVVQNSHYSSNSRFKCANVLEYRVLASLKIHYFVFYTPTLPSKGC